MNLTPEQFKNLEVFLSRIQLQGSEVPAFNDLIGALYRKDEPIVRVVEKEEVKKVKK